jgi:hypothetical protein
MAYTPVADALPIVQCEDLRLDEERMVELVRHVLEAADPKQLREVEHVLIEHGNTGEHHDSERTYVRCRMQDRYAEERSRPCRAGPRSPLPLSPEEEIRGRSGVRIADRVKL